MKIIIMLLGLCISTSGFAQEKQPSDLEASWDLYVAHQSWVKCRRNIYDRQVFNPQTSMGSIAVVATAVTVPLLESTTQAVVTYTKILDEVESNAKNVQMNEPKSETYEKFVQAFEKYLDVSEACSPQANQLIMKLENSMYVRVFSVNDK